MAAGYGPLTPEAAARALSVNSNAAASTPIDTRIYAADIDDISVSNASIGQYEVTPSQKLFQLNAEVDTWRVVEGQIKEANAIAQEQARMRAMAALAAGDQREFNRLPLSTQTRTGGTASGFTSNLPATSSGDTIRPYQGFFADVGAISNAWADGRIGLGDALRMGYGSLSFNHAGTRFGGALQALGGAAEVTVGAGLSSTVVGAAVGLPLVAHGTDNVQAGMRTAWNGEYVKPLTVETLEGWGVSPLAAELGNAGFGVAGIVGGPALAQKLSSIPYRLSIVDVPYANAQSGAIGLKFSNVTNSEVAAEIQSLSELKTVVTTRLQGHADFATSSVLSDQQVLLSQLSPARQAQYLRGSMQPALEGKAIENLWINTVASDPYLANYVTLGSKTRGPDFIFSGELKGLGWGDLTTQRSWLEHVNRNPALGYQGPGTLIRTR